LPEVRVDPLTGSKTIVAAERATRPGADWHAEPPPPLERDDDPFAEGNEARTPPEVYARRPDGSAPDTPGWQVRVVPNLFPALRPDAQPPPPDANRDLFAAQAAEGAHELIVNGPQQATALADLPREQVALALDVWRERMQAHSEASYVHVIVNEGRVAGASLPHTHAQLYALDFVPAALALERERFASYAVRTMGANLLADLVQEEVRRHERVVAIDDEAVLIAPYGGQLPFQLMVAPRRARACFDDAGPTGAALLHDALGRLARRLGSSPPLNLWVRTAPRGAEHFCWRIDILPRLTELAGLELGTGVHLNTIAPERAAAELREA
jgi:UDPglucose--hexose-1-phosphate uridylyltransferase